MLSQGNQYKTKAVVNIKRHRGNLAAKSGLEFACMNSDDFTILVSGGSRHHWESMCTVCGCHNQNDWVSRAMNLHQILHWAWTFLHGNYSDDSEGFQGWHNECSANKSVAQMLQRWLRLCWKWSTLWKAYNKQNTWECWMHIGCNQQRLVTDSVRTRSWARDSKNYCVWDFDAGSWNEMCPGKICSTASATRAEGISCCSCQWPDSTATNEPDFLKKVITGDESWFYGCDPETKAQLSQWKSSCSPHHTVKIKSTLSVLFD